MRWLIPAILVTACAHPTPPATASSAHPPAQVPGEERPVPADLHAEVRRVEGTASFLMESLDETIAAVHALQSSGEAPDPDLLAVLALPTPWAQGWDVLFVAERRAGGVAVVYEGRHADGSPRRSFERLDDPRPLVGVEVEGWAARQLAADRYLHAGTCHGAFQALVIPPHEGDEDFSVYILPTPGKGLLSVGGFRRIRVSRDGQHVLSDEPLTEGCRSISDAEKSIRIRNSLVEVPDEVSLMLAIGLPRTFEVTTARGRWDITSGRVRFLGEAAR